MSKMNGVEFLQIVKADQKLKKIPVIALTTFNAEQDIENCVCIGVAGYFIKTEDYDNTVNTIEKINLYWNLSELPSRGA
ncbi:response regulator [Planctomycetota bacterium]